jgi:hypothetical protein
MPLMHHFPEEIIKGLALVALDLFGGQHSRPFDEQIESCSVMLLAEIGFQVEKGDEET